jgi:hypothetical protein
MSSNSVRAADATPDESDDVYRRMLAARGRIRRWFSPDAMADADPDAPEVIGESLASHSRDR